MEALWTNNSNDIDTDISSTMTASLSKKLTGVTRDLWTSGDHDINTDISNALTISFKEDHGGMTCEQVIITNNNTMTIFILFYRRPPGINWGPADQVKLTTNHGHLSGGNNILNMVGF